MIITHIQMCVSVKIIKFFIINISNNEIITNTLALKRYSPRRKILIDASSSFSSSFIDLGMGLFLRPAPVYTHTYSLTRIASHVFTDSHIREQSAGVSRDRGRRPVRSGVVWDTADFHSCKGWEAKRRKEKKKTIGGGCLVSQDALTGHRASMAVART